MLKCICCRNLRREVIPVKGRSLVVYNCPPHFPYQAVLRGLLHPGKGIEEAADGCSDFDQKHCIVCGSDSGFVRYGIQVCICGKCDKAWGKWLDEHPGKREYIAPHGRARRDSWIEVFREFIEGARVDYERA
jgi:hypothetical protein